MRTVVGTLAPWSLQISSTSGWGRISTVIGPTLYVSPSRWACPVLRYPPWVAHPDSASARTKTAASRLRPLGRGRSNRVLGGAAPGLSIATLEGASRVPPPHPGSPRSLARSTPPSFHPLTRQALSWPWLRRRGILEPR